MLESRHNIFVGGPTAEQLLVCVWGVGEGRGVKAGSWCGPGRNIPGLVWGPWHQRHEPAAQGVPSLAHPGPLSPEPTQPCPPAAPSPSFRGFLPEGVGAQLLIPPTQHPCTLPSAPPACPAMPLSSRHPATLGPVATLTPPEPAAGAEHRGGEGTDMWPLRMSRPAPGPWHSPFPWPKHPPSSSQGWLLVVQVSAPHSPPRGLPGHLPCSHTPRSASAPSSLSGVPPFLSAPLGT